MITFLFYILNDLGLNWVVDLICQLLGWDH